MEKIEFQCEVITPMFCHGAYENSPEIRPATVKGLLRFWWRSANGHMELAELRKRESEIFGSSDDSGGRSSFNVRVKELGRSNGDEKLFGAKHGFSTGSKFKVIFSSQDKSKLEIIKNLFILLTTLGGIGTRTRRGLGAFKINSYLDTNGENKDYKKEINLEYIKSILNLSSEKKDNFNIEKNTLKIIKKRESFDFTIKIGRDYSNNIKNKKIGKAKEYFMNPNPVIGGCKEDFDKFKQLKYNNDKRHTSPTYISFFQDISGIKVVATNFSQFESVIRTNFKNTILGDANE